MSNIELHVENDYKYKKIIQNIIDNEEFNKIKKIEHHGITRYEHSLKVSYYSYKIAKFLHLNYREVARGGLLHDFFLNDEDMNFKNKFKLLFSHPKKAEKKAKSIFEINEKEADIIKSHMFPITLSVPKYAESWIVSLVDKTVAIYEFGKKFSKQISYSTSMYLLYLLNSYFM